MSAEADDSAVQPMEMAPHYYGGQAVIEGVMMRGRDTWAVAVRRATGDIYIEERSVSDLPRRWPLIAKPMIRGVFALADSLAIGMKALNISAAQSLVGAEDGVEEDEELPSVAIGASMLLAVVVFIGIFILLPTAGVKSLDTTLLGGVLGDGALFHAVESVVRVAIFLGYLWAISLIADIRRVFQYHGAEHMTIAAWEHDEPLRPEAIEGYSTLHVRCGTNFLILVMLLALVVYTVVGAVIRPPGDGFVVALVYHVLLRILLLPVIAGLAYEGLRLGAAHGENPFVAAMMRPGLWLQMLTTGRPSRDQIEVAVRAFETVVPAEHLDGRVPTGLESTVVRAAEEPDGVTPAPGQAPADAGAAGTGAAGEAEPPATR